MKTWKEEASKAFFGYRGYSTLWKIACLFIYLPLFYFFTIISLLFAIFWLTGSLLGWFYGMSALTLEKTRIHLFSPSHGKIVQQTGFFSLGKTTTLKERTLSIQNNCILLKNWLCVTSCSWKRGWVNAYIRTNFYLHNHLRQINTSLSQRDQFIP